MGNCGHPRVQAGKKKPTPKQKWGRVGEWETHLVAIPSRSVWFKTTYVAEK